MSLSFEQKDWAGASPPSTSFFPYKLFDSNFEIAILFSIVERFQNYTLRFNMTNETPEDRFGIESLLRIIWYEYCQVYENQFRSHNDK